MWYGSWFEPNIQSYESRSPDEMMFQQGAEKDNLAADKR
jgi:hypothetical protein